MQALGLIGKKLSHSLSQEYFREKFRSLGLSDIDYLLFELKTIDELPSLLKRQNDLVGFNVTVPYKEEVIKYLDEVDDVVKEVGAVNTVLFNKGKLKGFNTDVIGFEKLLLPLLEKSVHQVVKALILGTGGSSKAVQYVLKKHDIDFKLVSRTSHQGVLTYDELTENIITSHQLVINTTPLGMVPAVATFPEIPYEAITRQHVVIDLVYNPLETIFLKKGEMQGATIANGLVMLYAQADAAWGIWKSRNMLTNP